MFDAQELKRRLEQTGESKVRERLASNVYGLEEKGIVEEWLLSKEGKRNEERLNENIRLTKSAKCAAWIAAIAALIGAAVAIIALFLMRGG